MRAWALAASLLLLAGCSSVDLDGLEKDDLAPLHAELKDRAKGISIYIAPVAVVCSEEVFPEDDRGVRYPMRVVREKLPSEIKRCLEGAFTRVVVSKDPDASLEQARRVAYEEEHCDVILLPRVTRFDAVYVDTNGWWWPDMLFLAWYFYFPTYWIADQVYGAQVEVEYTVESLRNDHPLPGLERVTVAVDSLATERREGVEVPLGPRVALSGLDRGAELDLLGTYRPGKLTRDEWSAHVQPVLEPYARRDLSVRLARDVTKRFHDLDQDPGRRVRAMSALHAVVVGVKAYGNADPCPYADRDASAFAAWLSGESLPEEPLLARGVERRTPAKLVRKLLDEDASSSAVLAAVHAAVDASRREDTVVFYFAGRGRASNAAGAAGLGLACSNAARGDSPGADGVLSLEQLSAALDGGPDHAQERVVILDTTFGTGARGAEGQGGFTRAGDGVLRVFQEHGVFLLAAGGAEPANTLAPARHGLLTYALLDGASGAAGAPGETITWEKLRRHVERTIEALSRLEADSEQHPLAVMREDEKARRVLERE